MSVRNPTHGTKVTDPNAPEVRESAGAIASDSLAAESTRADAGFAENRNSEPQGVSDSNSTFANENTSGATRLDPASDAEARMAEADRAEEKKLGVAATSYQTHPSSGRASDIGTAPSHASSQFQDTTRPKGANLTEGGFDSRDSKNASFNSEIGSRDDPGRLAEQKFQRDNAGASAVTGLPNEQGTAGNNTYDSLGGDTSA
ncbi:hypothetical protein QTJ16_005001 [Diplocarpon rosae]|uniref:Uncharacterized protein n=1 Tax=Diplocarpon rosae TaxID=946125 RepID=A0AAD9SZ95_9HELO|nr:hypothetical protein QTJ16_005001 [Diplocarpon rosae]